jgi:plasmid stability protein
MISYIIRNIPADLWRQVKARAALEGVSVREVILRMLKDYTR